MDENRINVEVVGLVSETITESENLDMMANRVTQLLVGALGIKGATIFVVNPTTESLEIVAGAGLSHDYINKGPILVDKSIALASNREPVMISDVSKSEKLQYPEKARAEGIAAIVSFPINIRGKLIGALRLYHSEPWRISDSDITHLQMLIPNLGMALKYFRLVTAVETVKDVVNEIHPIWL